MTRALSFRCRALGIRIAFAMLAAFGVLGATAATAFAKQKVAVLTLEVVGNPDPDHLKLARALSSDLRERVKQSTDYALVGGDKDLVEEKLMNGCGNEALACMAPIGARLDAELLMFGKMDRTAKGFQVTIKVIRVSSRQYVNTWSDDIVLKRVADESKAVAKLAFNKLMPNQSGTLIVKVANVDRATVYIDGKPEGTLASGLYTTTLQANKYKVGIEAAEKGWMRYEEWVTIRAGEPTNVAAELTRIKPTPIEPVRDKEPDRDKDKAVAAELRRETSGTVSRSSKNTGWKVLAAGGLVTSAAAGGVWLWSYAKPISEYQGLLNDRKGATNADGVELDSRNCGETATAGPKDKFQDACRARTYVRFSAPITIAAGLVGAGALLYVLLKDDQVVEERPATSTPGRRTKKRSLAVTPVVTPDGAGASVRFDW